MHKIAKKINKDNEILFNAVNIDNKDNLWVVLGICHAVVPHLADLGGKRPFPLRIEVPVEFHLSEITVFFAVKLIG